MLAVWARSRWSPLMHSCRGKIGIKKREPGQLFKGAKVFCVGMFKAEEKSTSLPYPQTQV